MVRVLSQPAYPSGQRTPAEAVQALNAVKAAFETSYQFWLDDLSISDESVFQSVLIAGPRQVTDVYLLGLAARCAGTVVSFDRTLAWQAVQGGSEKLSSVRAEIDAQFRTIGPVLQHRSRHSQPGFSLPILKKPLPPRHPFLRRALLSARGLRRCAQEKLKNMHNHAQRNRR